MKFADNVIAAAQTQVNGLVTAQEQVLIVLGVLLAIGLFIGGVSVSLERNGRTKQREGAYFFRAVLFNFVLAALFMAYTLSPMAAQLGTLLSDNRILTAFAVTELLVFMSPAIAYMVAVNMRRLFPNHGATLA